MIVGDNVVLNSGGPIMEVVAILGNGDVSVMWRADDGDPVNCSHIFHPQMLTKV